MSNTLYYFTGTGNSLAVTQQVAHALGESEIVSIPRIMRNKGPVCPHGTIGIISPVYFLGLPDIVVRFIKKLDPSQVNYLFLIITMGGTGASAVRQCEDLLGEKGHPPDAEFTVLMPDNYLPMFEIKTEEETRPVLENARIVTEHITSVVIGKKTEMVPVNPVKNALFRMINRVWVRNVHSRDKRFLATGACTSCRTCEKVCPVDNITVAAEKRPVWHHRCEQCFACIQFCPASAIEFGKKTTGKRRYHHPDITAKKLMEELGRTS